MRKTLLPVGGNELLLGQGDEVVTEGQRDDISVQAVSKHLTVLAEAGLVSKHPQAQTRLIHLEAEMFDLMTSWLERYRRQAEERYARLDTVLAELQTGEQRKGLPHD